MKLMAISIFMVIVDIYILTFLCKLCNLYIKLQCVGDVCFKCSFEIYDFNNNNIH